MRLPHRIGGGATAAWEALNLWIQVRVLAPERAGSSRAECRLDKAEMGVRIPPGALIHGRTEHRRAHLSRKQGPLGVWGFDSLSFRFRWRARHEVAIPDTTARWGAIEYENENEYEDDCENEYEHEHDTEERRIVRWPCRFAKPVPACVGCGGSTRLFRSDDALTGVSPPPPYGGDSRACWSRGRGSRRPPAKRTTSVRVRPRPFRW